jgi:protein-tyrosine phosphatase
MHAKRILDLTGGQNFREVGGYPTRCGGRVRRGLIWRSARLDALSDEDIKIIRGLGINTIADLRRRGERNLQPTKPELLTGMRVLAWDDPKTITAKPQEALYQPGATAAQYYQAMLDLYRLIAETHAEHLRRIYQEITRDALPILIHCSAGKDRTGIAVALLLEALGVERSDVIADYVRTESLVDWGRLNAAAATGAGVGHAWMGFLDPTALELLLRADARYLEAALADIEDRHGSVIGFFRNQLGLDQSTLDALKARLLEPLA